LPPDRTIHEGVFIILKITKHSCFRRRHQGDRSSRSWHRNWSLCWFCRMNWLIWSATGWFIYSLVQASKQCNFQICCMLHIWLNHSTSPFILACLGTDNKFTNKSILQRCVQKETLQFKGMVFPEYEGSNIIYGYHHRHRSSILFTYCSLQDLFLQKVTHYRFLQRLHRIDIPYS